MPLDASKLVLDLRLEGLRFETGSHVLGAIALQMAKGETLAITGPSGIGKTSLLRIIAGLEDAYAGQCIVSGRTSMVFQEPTLLPWRTVLENLCITTGVCEKAARDTLDEVGLAGRADEFPGRLSLGQKRRLSLARAFAHKPDLLLMDEPFVSLDPALAAEMMALFVKLRATHAVATILVTHIAAEATQLADRIINLGGAPAQILSGPNPA